MFIYQGENRIYNSPEDLLNLQNLIIKENEVNSSNTTTYSYRLEKFFIYNGINDIFDIVNCFISVVFIIFYIIDTYNESITVQRNSFEIYLLVILIFHFFIKLYISQTRLYFILSFETLIDFGTIVGILLFNLNVFDNNVNYFIRIFKMLRFLYLFKIEYVLQKRTNDTIRYSYKLIFNILAIILISSAFMLEVENDKLRLQSFERTESIRNVTINQSNLSSSNSTLQNLTNSNSNSNSNLNQSLINSTNLNNSENNSSFQSNLNRYMIGKVSDSYEDSIYNFESLINENRYKLYNFNDMIYFTLVTLGTIGFGDIVPRTTLGRMIVIITVFLLLALIPTLTTKLLSALNLSNKYSRIYYSKISDKSKHLVLLGTSGIEGFEAFLNELYHEDHGIIEYHTVIMQNDVNESLVNLINKLPYSDFIYYLSGNSLKNSDLERCKIEKSICVVLLANKQAKNSKQEDFYNILQAFSIKKYCKIKENIDVRVCMQLLMPETKEIFFQSLLNSDDLSSLDQVICVEEIKFFLLSKSCICPGINTILSCLITSNKPKMEDIEEKENISNQMLSEYISGMQYEIYRIKMKGNVIDGIKFIHLVRIIYDLMGIVVIGCDCKLDSFEESMVCINPYNYLFNGSDHIIYILSDKLPDTELLNDQVLSRIKHDERDINFENQYLLETYNDIRSKGKDNEKVIYNEINTHIDKLRIKNKIKRKQNFIQTIYPRTGHESEHFSFEILSNHIIIIGLSDNMKYLLLPLRRMGLKAFQHPILIFDKEEHIPSEIWKDIQFFPDVYYMQGNPIKAKDLLRARIKEAKAVILLGKRFKSDELSGEMVDADTIFTYKAIRNENKNLLIITELCTLGTLSFLSNYDSKIEKDYRFTDQFATGEIYNSSMLDTLMCQAFYNPFITNIIQQFILGSSLLNLSPKKMEEINKKKISFSSLYLLNIYEEFERWDVRNTSKNMTFQFIFWEFIERNMVPIGIYRGSKREVSQHKSFMNKYVFLMPNKNTNINIETDKIYVLACDEEIENKNSKGRDLSNMNNYFVKQLEKSNDQALKLNETLKDLIKLQTHFFKNEFSIKVITENTRLSLRSELAKIYENQIS